MYTIYYEIEPNPGYSFWLGAAFLTIGLVAIVVTFTDRRRRRHERTRLPPWAIVAVMLGGLAVGVTWLKHERVYGAYAAGAAEVIEGTVRVLRQQPAYGHAPGDLIEVGGRRLEVNYFTTAPGYRTTIAHGGVLTEGAVARLGLCGETIVRVEVRSGG